MVQHIKCLQSVTFENSLTFIFVYSPVISNFSHKTDLAETQLVQIIFWCHLQLHEQIKVLKMHMSLSNASIGICTI